MSKSDEFEVLAEVEPGHVSFELPVEVLDQLAVQGIQRAARGLAEDIAQWSPACLTAGQFEDLYHWHRYLDAMNTVLEYFGGDPVMPGAE